MKFKKLLPHGIAIVIFAIVTAAFFSPLVFDGKKIGQSDINHFNGAAKEIQDYRAKHNGEDPLWTNSMFGGMPAYQISVKYPNNYVKYVSDIFGLIIPTPATAIFLCMVGFYFLLFTLKLDPWLSIGGAIAFGFSSFFIIILQVGHNTQAFAIAYMAPVLMGVLMAMRGRMWLGGAITAISLALELYSNHLQITFYLLMTILFVGIGEAIRLIRAGEMKYLIRAAAVLFAAVFIAILPNLTNLYLTEEYGKYSTRGPSDLKGGSKALDFDYATQYSYPVGESMTLMIPDVAGGASQAIGEYDPGALDAIDGNQEIVGKYITAYFGEQGGTAGPVYVGAIICFLFVLGLLIVKDNIKWWLLGATVVSVMLSWGSNFPSFSHFFFNYFPAYNKFRAVSMILVIAELTMPILAMLAIREIVKDPAVIKQKIRLFYIALAITGGLSLITWMMPSYFSNPGSEANKAEVTSTANSAGIKDKAGIDNLVYDVEQARIAIVKSDALRSFFFILLAGGVLYFYIRKPFGVIPLAGALGLLMLLDMYGVASRYLSDDKGNYSENTASELQANSADLEINKDPDPDFRVWNMTVNVWADASTSYFHKSLGGYHGAKLKRTQELYDSSLSYNIRAVGSAFQQPNATDSSIQAAFKRAPNINMLNVKYLINGYYDQNRNVVYYPLENKSACGHAWFVRESNIVDDADAELNAVKSFDPLKTAVVDKKFEAQIAGFKPVYDSAAYIKLLSYEPNDLKYESNAASDQLAVFSEIYYDKGWDVYVDGKKADYMRADYVLRAMKVPAGKHNIEFKFEPSFYSTGEKIALVGSLLLFLFVGGGIYFDNKQRKQASPKAA